MAWEWSHTHEAYRNGELNLHDLPRDELLTIAAEWAVSTRDDLYNWDFDSEAYDAERARMEAEPNLTNDALAGSIWRSAEELATCDNGGFNAWVCPHGCHTVPFDRVPQDGDDNL